MSFQTADKTAKSVEKEYEEKEITSACGLRSVGRIHPPRQETNSPPALPTQNAFPTQSGQNRLRAFRWPTCKTTKKKLSLFPTRISPVDKPHYFTVSIFAQSYTTMPRSCQPCGHH